MEGIGRVVRQDGPKGYFAIVHLRYEPKDWTGVSADFEWSPGYQSQESWAEAAHLGAVLGMEFARVNGVSTITFVRGMICDTSPPLVAIAAMRAVWQAVDFTPHAEFAESIEACVPRGHWLSLPELESLVREGDRITRLP